MRRLPTRLGALITTALLSSTLSVGLAGPAQAAPPVVVDDTMTIHGNTVHFLDNLLANDSDPDGDELALCRMKEVMNNKVVFTNLLGFPILAASPKTSGTFTFTYYACDFETLVPGTLTVHVKPAATAKIKVTKLPKRPGKVKVTNRSNFGLDFSWGHADEELPDQSVRIGKKATKVVTVRRTAITWEAYNEGNGAEKRGYLRGITLPRKGKSLPPSPRPRAAAPFSLAALLSEPSWLAPLGLRQRQR